MPKKFDCRNQKGFTLIEIVSVMIIMGVVASVSIQKLDVVTDNAHEKALLAGISEINVRESLVWSNLKISKDGYSSDDDLWLLMKADLGTDLGDDYEWDPNPPNKTGGTLIFNTASRSLTRQPSTPTTAARWD